MKRLATIGAVGLLALGGVAAQAQTPPPRQAFPSGIVMVLHGTNGKVCFKGTRAELRRQLLRGTLCLRTARHR